MSETGSEFTASHDERRSDMAAAADRQLSNFGYCGSCGSWDAHGRECLSCGYDFQSSPGKSPPSD